MMRIKIFSDFCDSKGAKEVYEKICDAANLPFYGEDKEVWFTGKALIISWGAYKHLKDRLSMI